MHCCMDEAIFFRNLVQKVANTSSFRDFCDNFEKDSAKQRLLTSFLLLLKSKLDEFINMNNL